MQAGAADVLKLQELGDEGHLCLEGLRDLRSALRSPVVGIGVGEGVVVGTGVAGGKVVVLGAAVVVGTGVAGGKVVVLGAAVVVGIGVAAAEGQRVSCSRAMLRCRRGQQMLKLQELGDEGHLCLEGLRDLRSALRSPVVRIGVGEGVVVGTGVAGGKVVVLGAAVVVGTGVAGGKVVVLGAAVVVGTGVAGGKVVVLGAAVVVGTGVAAAEGQGISCSRFTPRCRAGQQIC